MIKISPLSETLAEAARKGAEIKNLGKMCSDCAFRPQPNINGYDDAVLKAMECLAYYQTFNCHTPDYKNAGKVCTGFLYAKQYYDQLEKQQQLL